MKVQAILLAMAFGLGLAGCASNTPSKTALDSGVPLVAQYNVADVRVSVPRTLVVSEADSIFPSADIVWREERAGNRYEQVQRIVSEAAAQATAGMTSGPRVVVDIQMERFHALTPRARASIGGTHSMRFLLTVRDAASGQVIDGPRVVVADTPAAGGAQAEAEMAAGRTQRAVIQARLAAVLRAELSVPPAPAG